MNDTVGNFANLPYTTRPLIDALTMSPTAIRSILMRPFPDAAASAQLLHVASAAQLLNLEQSDRQRQARPRQR